MELSSSPIKKTSGGASGLFHCSKFKETLHFFRGMRKNQELRHTQIEIEIFFNMYI